MEICPWNIYFIWTNGRPHRKHLNSVRDNHPANVLCQVLGRLRANFQPSYSNVYWTLGNAFDDEILSPNLSCFSYLIFHSPIFLFKNCFLISPLNNFILTRKGINNKHKFKVIQCYLYFNILGYILLLHFKNCHF